MTERDAQAFADSRLSVLVYGETGTGKRTVCARLHAGAGPLVFASPAQLERGPRSRRALAATARGGGLVIVRPAALSPPAQLDLGVVIDDLGDDVRWFATTAADPIADRIAGRLTAELYFRIAGITIVLRPLRDFGTELDAIVRERVAHHAARLARAVPAVTEDALALLRAAPWLGNHRELDQVIERWLRTTTTLDAATLARVVGEGPTIGRALGDELAAYERRRIREALERFDGNQTRAAKLLGMPRRTFLKRLETYGLG